MTVASWMLPGVNAPHRHALGWLPEEAAVITASGVYQLTTLAAAPGTAGAPRALLVPKADTNERYYLSYRTPIGFDRYIDAAYHYQLSVHRYRGDGTVARTFLLAWLGDGRTFVDEVNGLAVTLVSHTDTSATVRVEFTSPCVPAAPTIAVTPQSQTAFAGTSVSYAVSITNHDAPACAPRALALSGVYPAGWTGLIEPSTVPVNGGASAQAIVSLTSPVSAGQGTYGATITTADAVTGPVSAVATYVVQSALDSRPPDAPSGLSATVNSRKKQIGLTWQAASDDRGVAGYRILRNGVIVGTSASTAWIDTAWSAGASYQYAVVAYDAAGNVSAPSAGVNVTLSGGGKKR